MAAKTGKKSSYEVMPDEEFVVTPKNRLKLNTLIYNMRANSVYGYGHGDEQREGQEERHGE